MLKHTTIPDFDQNDLQSVATTVRSLKEIVETLAGLRQGEALGAPQMFVQATTPANSAQLARVKLTAPAKGDLWVNTSAGTIAYYDGNQWIETVSSVTP